MKLSRRNFFSTSFAGAVITTAIRPAYSSIDVQQIPIIDTHTHFYDPTRPEGIPWPAKTDSLLYRKVLPAEFKTVTKPYGVVGTIIVEASPWVEDNQWLLDLAANDPFIVGIVGNLTPGEEQFAAHLQRFKRNTAFRGIRLGSGQLAHGIDRPEFLKDIQRLIEADLEVDLLGGPDMLPLVAQLAKQFPQLRIVINHLANVKIDGNEPPEEWKRGVLATSKHPNVFMKVSATVENGRIDGRKASSDVSFYRPTLRTVWNAFGEDRLIFGSDWPCSDVGGDYGQIVNIVKDFFADFGIDASKKFFSTIAQAAYRWPSRVKF